MRILVTGGRDFGNIRALYKVLDDIKPTEICQGGAKGADLLALNYAIGKNIPHKTYPANWKKHGKAAGMIRNREMLEDFKPDIVVAFPGGVGTAAMVKIAKAAGVLVCIAEQAPDPAIRDLFKGKNSL